MKKLKGVERKIEDDMKLKREVRKVKAEKKKN